jgi:hypothetical protein
LTAHETEDVGADRLVSGNMRGVERGDPVALCLGVAAGVE